MMERAAEFCAEAARLVGGDRAATHGDKTINFQNIAELWNGYLVILARIRGVDYPFLGPEDVGSMMELMKVARRLSGSYNPDDYVDSAGYAGCAGEIAARAAKIAAKKVASNKTNSLGSQSPQHPPIHVVWAEDSTASGDNTDAS